MPNNKDVEGWRNYDCRLFFQLLLLEGRGGNGDGDEVGETEDPDFWDNYNANPALEIAGGIAVIANALQRRVEDLTDQIQQLKDELAQLKDKENQRGTQRLTFLNENLLDYRKTLEAFTKMIGALNNEGLENWFIECQNLLTVTHSWVNRLEQAVVLRDSLPLHDEILAKLKKLSMKLEILVTLKSRNTDILNIHIDGLNQSLCEVISDLTRLDQAASK